MSTLQVPEEDVQPHRDQQEQNQEQQGGESESPGIAEVMKEGSGSKDDKEQQVKEMLKYLSNLEEDRRLFRLALIRTTLTVLAMSVVLFVALLIASYARVSVLGFWTCLTVGMTCLVVLNTYHPMKVTLAKLNMPANVSSSVHKLSRMRIQISSEQDAIVGLTSCWWQPCRSLIIALLASMMGLVQVLVATGQIQDTTASWPWLYGRQQELCLAFAALSLLASFADLGVICCAACFNGCCRKQKELLLQPSNRRSSGKAIRTMVLISGLLTLAAFVTGAVYCSRWSVPSDKAVYELFVRVRDGYERDNFVKQYTKDWPRVQEDQDRLVYPNLPWMTLSTIRDGSAVPLVVLLGCTSVLTLLRLFKVSEPSKDQDQEDLSSRPGPKATLFSGLALTLILCGLFASYSRVILSTLSAANWLEDTLYRNSYVSEWLMSTLPILAAMTLMTLVLKIRKMPKEERESGGVVFLRVLVFLVFAVTLTIALYSMVTMSLLYVSRFYYFQIRFPEGYNNLEQNNVCFYNCTVYIDDGYRWNVQDFRSCSEICIDKAKMCDGIVDVGGDPGLMPPNTFIYTGNDSSRLPFSFWKGSNRYPMADEAFCLPESLLWTGLVKANIAVAALCLLISASIALAMAPALKKAAVLIYAMIKMLWQNLQLLPSKDEDEAEEEDVNHGSVSVKSNLDQSPDIVAAEHA